VSQFCPQNLPKIFFGKGSEAKLVAYLGNETFGRFLLIRASAKLRHCAPISCVIIRYFVIPNSFNKKA
jgi:hypothetical protein